MCATDDDFVLVQTVLASPLIFCTHTLVTIPSIENYDYFFAFSCHSRNLVSD